MPSVNQIGPLDSMARTSGDASFFRLNNRLGSDQLKPGEVSNSENGRMDLDGAWQPRKGMEVFGSILTTTEATLQAGPIDFLWVVDEYQADLSFLVVSPTPVSVSSATRVGAVVTITTSSAHGIASTAVVYVDGLSGTATVNGNRVVKVTGASELQVYLPGATGSETYSGSGTVDAARLAGEVVLGVYGSCRFSDPSDSNAEYIIRATNYKAIATSVADGTETDIAYPSGITITSDVELIQCFDRVIMFIGGSTALEWDGDLSGTPAFTRVANGAYTQPTYYNTASNTVIADGVVTVSEASHGLSVGDKIYVVENGSTELLQGQETDSGYTVATVPTSGSFTFYAEIPDHAATSVVYTKKISVGTGYTHMPAPAWGTYHQRRLWVPYAYTMAGSSGASPTITARNVSDEIIASDILDSDTYDRLQNQFRITAGTADYVVALEPFAEDNLLAFNRNSIHLLSGVSGSIADVSVRLITSEVGCVARKSIVQVGNQVLFLSDNGVYSANFGDLYNLRGAGVPLSEPIQATINRINRDYAYKAVGAYYNNRYYLAVPLDANTTNSTILVYNFLNQGWESIDSVGSEGFNVTNFIPASNGGLNNLYAISLGGAIHRLEVREDGNDILSLYGGITAATYYVPSTVSTRAFNADTAERKKWSRLELHLESSSSEASNATLSVDVRNPDSTTSVGTVESIYGSLLAPDEDASLRARIGNKRGYSAKVVFSPTAGRPRLRAVSLTSTLTNTSVVNAA
jgi:hypothetical protein